jgi:hypothetical protein
MTSKRRPTRAEIRRRKAQRTRILRRVGLVAAVGLVIGFFAYNAATGGAKSACVLLVDRTSSSQDEETVDKYRELGERAIAGCADEAALMTIYYFDQQVGSITATLGDPVELQRGGESKAIEALDDALQAESRLETGSDVLGAIAQGGEVLAEMRADVDGPGYLIVLSDGIHVDSNVSVYSITNERDSINPLINTAIELDLIPNLDGVQVDFVGTYSGRSQVEGVPSESGFESNVENFWVEVVRQGGGTLCTYASEASSLPSSRCDP